VANVNTKYTSLNDIAKQLDPKGDIAPAIEMMGKLSPFIKKLPMVQANGKTYHQASVRVGLPTATWVKLNGGSAATKSKYAQITETMGILESWQETDVRIAKLSGNVAKFRAQQAIGHLESVTQQAEDACFYADRSSPEKPLGLAARYNALTGSEISQNVVSGGGSGSDNASIYMGTLGEMTLTGIYPEGHQAGGVEHDDFSQQVSENMGGTSGNLGRVIRERWGMTFGIALLDWRYFGRIPNIDVSNIIAKSSAADVTELLFDLESRFPHDYPGRGRQVIFCNRTIYREWMIQRRDDVGTGGGFTFMNVDGEQVLVWKGGKAVFEICVTDALLNTEATVA
jgi:hypothetical protein